MASLDDLKKTFFDECDEAMQQIEIGLTDIRSGEGNDETINAVFRGVHSVKGGAGIMSGPPETVDRVTVSPLASERRGLSLASK